MTKLHLDGRGSLERLRIACLEPAATQVCLALGLAHKIVGVTHECDFESIRKARGDIDDSNSNKIHVLTQNGLDEGASQADIHIAVSNEGERRQQVEACFDDDQSNCDNFPVSSLYPIVRSAWEQAKPTLCFTQDLCAVCAPTPLDVKRMAQLTENSGDGKSNESLVTVSLQPKSLTEVADTFVTVANNCFSKNILDSNDDHPGKLLQKSFWKDLKALQTAIETNRDKTIAKPKFLMLEWLDPFFSGGHWVHAMMDYACITSAIPPPTSSGSQKSPCISWSVIEKSDPDGILVGCCGFSLQRNVKDAAATEKFHTLRAAKLDTIFACDGNSYFAQPTPLLVHGVAILATCAYQNQPAVLKAIEECCQAFETPLIPMSSSAGWEKVKLLPKNDGLQTTQGSIDDKTGSFGIIDMEDLGGFHALHQQACEEGKTTYIDPSTGYQVFTEVAHKNRGKCCGSGCRHCPYNHVNVKDKLSRIQNPALLYKAPPGELFACSEKSNIPVKVLFFSGGKDSFLTIRALVRQHQREKNKFGLVLLTTFDAGSRVIAHQEVSIEDVTKQAEHLRITLLGVPLHRGSGQSYVDRIATALKALDQWNVTTLVFGDLHLEHIKDWRESVLAPLGFSLEYPVWKVPYNALMDDLESSRVPCTVSGSTCDMVAVGTLFDRAFYSKLVSEAPKGISIETTKDGEPISRAIDAFGENGEFHSLAQVWKVGREQALGLN